MIKGSNDLLLLKCNQYKTETSLSVVCSRLFLVVVVYTEEPLPPPCRSTSGGVELGCEVLGLAQILGSVELSVARDGRLAEVLVKKDVRRGGREPMEPLLPFLCPATSGARLALA